MEEKKEEARTIGTEIVFFVFVLTVFLIVWGYFLGMVVTSDPQSLTYRIQEYTWARLLEPAPLN
eukprot:547159-Amphidinium_carterae.1